MNGNPMLGRLRRIRWAVRATLALGVAASVAANILHAQPNPISQGIAAWPPLALLLTVELVSRVPLHRPLLAVVRVLATVVISGIAAWVSYWHMHGVAARYGETDASPYLLPVSVDGLIVVASICLVELASRIRLLEEPAPTVQPSTVAIHQPATAPQLATGPVTVAQLGDDGQVLDDQPGPELVASAHQVAVEHRRRTARDITRDQPGEALPASNIPAGQPQQATRTSGVERRPVIATLGGPTR